MKIYKSLKFTYKFYYVLPIITFTAGLLLSRFDLFEERTSNDINSSFSTSGNSESKQKRFENLATNIKQKESNLREVKELSQQLTSENITKIGNFLISESDPLRKRQIFDLLLSGLTTDNALEIREQVIKLDQEGTEFRDFHRIWGSMAGAEAVIHGAASEETDIHMTMEGWVNSDPDSAIEWYNGLDELKIEGIYRDYVKKCVVEGLAKTNVPRAVEFIKGLQKKGDRQVTELLNQVTARVSREMSLKDAGEWASSLPNPQMQKISAKTIGSKFGYSNPQLASEWATSLSPELAAEAVPKVGESWARRDPEASSNWLTSFPESSAINGAVEKSFQSWAHIDPKSASNYLIEMNESGQKDMAIKGFVSRVVHEDPEAAILWADSINNESVKNDAMIKAGSVYLRRDYSNANQWLESSGLPDTIKAKINSPSKK